MKNFLISFFTITTRHCQCVNRFHKILLLFCFILCLASCSYNRINNISNIDNVSLTYKKEKQTENYDVYNLEMEITSKHGNHIKYFGSIGVLNKKFSQDENTLHSFSSSGTCSINNYIPRDIKQIDYIKKIRCKDMDNLYLRLINDKLIIKEYDDTINE